MNIRKLFCIHVLLAVAFIPGCSLLPDGLDSGHGFIGEITDPSKYSGILDDAGDHPALAHFPASIPENSSLVRFHFHPRVFQGNSVLQLRIRLSEEELEALYAEFLEESKYVFPAEAGNDGFIADGEVRTTRFYTVDDAMDFPGPFEIFVLDAIDLGGDDAHWNHGVSYGVAISRASSEIVYWYEEW